MSKIDCGSLIRVGKDGIEFRGTVHLGQRLDGLLILRKHSRAGTSEDHPDFIVEYSPHGGRPRPVGAGWLKNSERVSDFISMTLDDPDWPSPINLTAFSSGGDRNDASWVIVWSRPRGARVQDQGASDDGKSAISAP